MVTTTNFDENGGLLWPGGKSLPSATERLEAILKAHPCLVGEGEKMAAHEPCFACGKPMKSQGVLVDTRDDQRVYVGPECLRRIEQAGDAGFKPERGGPRLFLIDPALCYDCASVGDESGPIAPCRYHAVLESDNRRLREEVARLAVALENAQKSATYFMTAHDKLREAAQRVVRSHEQIKKSIKDECGEDKAMWMSERIAAIDALAALLKGQ